MCRGVCGACSPVTHREAKDGIATTAAHVQYWISVNQSRCIERTSLLDGFCLPELAEFGLISRMLDSFPRIVFSCAAADDDDLIRPFLREFQNEAPSVVHSGRHASRQFALCTDRTPNIYLCCMSVESRYFVRNGWPKQQTQQPCSGCNAVCPIDSLNVMMHRVAAEVK